MIYVTFNIANELKKAAQGKKLKPGVDMGVLLYLATEGYPHIQALLAEAFSITAD